MGKEYKLKDGTNVAIRPLVAGDLKQSLAFFQSLTPEDRLYLRVDVLDKKVVERRIHNSGIEDFKRIVAEIDGKIAADAGLELRTHGWERHLADFRLIIAPQFRRMGLGMIMAEELYEMAIREQVEEMVVKIMAPQAEAKKIFQRLGFKEDVVIKNFVKDINGRKQDLILMRCSLDAIWDKIESYFQEMEHREMREENL
jgi:ribosomal protein S18 acetylase RimI-like enzyme